MAKKPKDIGILWPETQVVFRMTEKNVPLSQWKRFMESGDQGTGYRPKNHEKIAAAIFRQLSHPDAVAIVAHEWEHLGPEIRMALGTLASDGNCSGNVKKGCQELNRILDGRLLSQKKPVQTTSLRGKTIVVNPAIAGAARKYGVDDRRFQIRR